MTTSSFQQDQDKQVAAPVRQPHGAQHIILEERESENGTLVLHRHPHFFVFTTSHPDHRSKPLLDHAANKLPLKKQFLSPTSLFTMASQLQIDPLRPRPTAGGLHEREKPGVGEKAPSQEISLSTPQSVEATFAVAQLASPVKTSVFSVPTWLEAVLVVVGLVVSFAAHAYNMFNFPHHEQDEGVYINSAWAITYGRIDPYPYGYGHPPLAWMQIAAWVKLTGGFFTFGNGINSGRVLMLLFALGCSFLVYQITRRMGGSLSAGLLAMIIFSLSPLSITFQREVLLDNFATFWFLLSLYLIVVGKSHLFYTVFAAISFGIAFLSKEVIIVLLPVLIYAVWLHTAKFQRTFALVAFTYIVIAVCSAWVLLAILKGELLPYAWHLPWDNHPHLSMLDTVIRQVHRSQSQGKIIDSWNAWTKADPMLIFFGFAAPAFNLILGWWSRKHLFLSLFAISYWALLLRGGVIFPFYITPLLPLIALNAVLALNTLVNWSSKLIRFDLVHALLVFCVIAAIVPYDLQHSTNPINLFTLRPVITQQEALVWVRDHIPRRAMIVTSSIFYTDLHEPGGEGVGDGAIYPYAEVYWNVGLDPGVHDTLLKGNWDRIDYIIADSETLNDIKTYGSGMLIIYQALLHSVLRAQFFGDDYEFIQIYQVIHKVTPPTVYQNPPAMKLAFGKLSAQGTI